MVVRFLCHAETDWHLVQKQRFGQVIVVRSQVFARVIHKFIDSLAKFGFGQDRIFGSAIVVRVLDRNRNTFVAFDPEQPDFDTFSGATPTRIEHMCRQKPAHRSFPAVICIQVAAFICKMSIVLADRFRPLAILRLSQHHKFDQMLKRQA